MHSFLINAETPALDGHAPTSFQIPCAKLNIPMVFASFTEAGVLRIHEHGSLLEELEAEEARAFYMLAACSPLFAMKLDRTSNTYVARSLDDALQSTRYQWIQKSEVVMVQELPKGSGCRRKGQRFGVTMEDYGDAFIVLDVKTKKKILPGGASVPTSDGKLRSEKARINNMVWISGDFFGKKLHGTGNRRTSVMEYVFDTAGQPIDPACLPVSYLIFVSFSLSLSLYTYNDVIYHH